MDHPEIRLVNIDRELITVDPGDILSLLLPSREKEDKHITGLVNDTIELCRKIMEPAGAYVICDAEVSKNNGLVKAGGVTFRTGKIIRHMLSGADRIALFIVTAGPAPEAFAGKRMGEGAYLEGYVADLVGSGIAESTAGLLYEQVREYAISESLKVTNRYSPGYCSWNVMEQQKLFRLFPDKCCGITLTEHSLMSPVKSVSGMIGLGAGVKFREYLCENCSQKDCIFRKPLK